MALSVEFRIPVEVLPLGSVIAKFDNVSVELVRVVPTRDGFIPYFWVAGEELDAFERALEENRRILALKLLDVVDRSRLYQAEWDAKYGGFFAGVIDTDAAVLEAYTADGKWLFHFGFRTTTNSLDFITTA